MHSVPYLWFLPSKVTLTKTSGYVIRILSRMIWQFAPGDVSKHTYTIHYSRLCEIYHRINTKRVDLNLQYGERPGFLLHRDLTVQDRSSIAEGHCTCVWTHFVSDWSSTELAGPFANLTNRSVPIWHTEARPAPKPVLDPCIAEWCIRTGVPQLNSWKTWIGVPFH